MSVKFEIALLTSISFTKAIDTYDIPLSHEDKCALWDIDQLDPDNWFEIPEFGVRPEDVSFAGFAFPIVDPKPDAYGARPEVRDLVKTCRVLARKKFASLKVLEEAAVKGFQLIDQGTKPESDQRVALLYMLSMRGLAKATNSPYLSSEAKFSELARAAATVATWASGDLEGALKSLRDRFGRDRMVELAQRPRPNRRDHDHDELLTAFRRALRAGLTVAQARKSLVGKFGSQSTINRVTKKFLVTNGANE